MSHLKTYAAPKSWNILRKTHKWILRPQPGAHPLEITIPVGLLLREKDFGKTRREIKQILNDKAVTIDGKIVKDLHYGVGFMDVITVKPNTILRCSIDQKGRLEFIEISKEEANKKLCKIIGKKTARGNKIQYSLSDGRNILAEKSQYKTGDALLIEVPSQKILEHIPLEKGISVFLTGGSNIRTIGTIQEIKGNKITLTKDKETIESDKKFALAIGKEKPAIKL
ncbi:30S ribosomal protein S4e [Candidatus Woesearchaeota archaeon]|nr:30S ribosomal protein S4e [Candidatus Woesearchaeota archaeon]MBW3016556.1 30S ribosomal protein S4e [Candidatus Woesearchaeota archaeon]